MAFPAFLGNPAIKEEPRVPCGKFSLGFSRLSRKPRNQGKTRMCQQSFWSEAPGFFAHKEKPGKRGNFLSRLSWLFQEFLESQEGPDTLGFSGLFPGFSLCAKKPGKPGILPRNSGEFLAPFCRGSQCLKILSPVK